MKKIITYIVPLIISLLIVFISFNEEIWIKFWAFLHIPSQLPPFSDLDAISRALNAKESGLNPFFDNPYDLSKKPYSYPSIWLYFFDIFNLNYKLNFQIFNLVIIYLYSLVYFKLSLKVNKRFFSILLCILFLSTSNFLVIERLNIEIIIFVLIYCLAISTSYKTKIFFYITTFYAKLYPIFAIFIFLKNKKILVSMIIISFFILFLLKEEIFLIMSNSNEVALNIAYGIPTLTKGLWYYSTKFGYFINDNNYILFKYLMILLGSIYALILILYSFKFGEKKITTEISIEEKLFICGGGIFIGRFINFSNVDYSLIFLIFTIPFILKNELTIKNIIYFVCLIISFNSIYFEGGNRYTLLYLSKGVFIHSVKIILFSIICYHFGKILNDHLKINFKKNSKILS